MPHPGHRTKCLKVNNFRMNSKPEELVGEGKEEDFISATD
jgi:hypothetical protein